MIAEKWDLKLSVDKLRDYLFKSVVDKEITQQSKAFGGWSVLSSDGDYRDGWVQGHLLYVPEVSEDVKNQIRSQLNKRTTEYTYETEICTGYMKDVITLIRRSYLYPYRARVIRLSAGMASSWHRDAPNSTYAVRLHIPIVTNEGCFFETRSGREHLPADGSAYFLYVNNEHRVVNEGTADRFHLVMDVTDTLGISKHHRFHEFKPI